jgi:Tfp pilus assembly protein PilF
MSLLLDALKKTGAAQAGLDAKSAPMPELTLTELDLEAKPHQSAPLAAPTPTTPRSTGENLFSAKKAPARRRFKYNLGLIPTALIIGAVLGIAGSVYVWIEIQPPKPVPNSASRPTSTVSSAPEPRSSSKPLVLPAAPINEPDFASNSTQLKTENVSTQADNAKPTISTIRLPKRPDRQIPAPGIQFQHQTETDGIYATLTVAYQAYKSGDLAIAWQRYREVLLKDSKNRDALLGMAAIAQQQGQDEAAIQYYKQVLILDPRDPEAKAGMSTFSTADPAAKESHLKLSLAQTPQSAILHFSLGNIYTEQSRWGEAQQSYFNAFRLEPANAQYAFNLATSLDHLGQGKLAAQYYAIALQLDATGNAGFDRVLTQIRMNQLQAP